MRLTDVTIVNKDARAWRKSVTLYESVARRLAWHEKNSSTKIGAGHRIRAREIMDACRREQDAELPGREINSYLSSRAILNVGVREIMAWVFAGLPEPGPAQHDDVTAELVKMMNNKGRETRAANHRWNLMSEIAYRTTHGWYILFNTLTVRDGAYMKVFAKESKEFKNYVRQFERCINEAEDGVRNTPKGTGRPDNHRYFAVVEEGGSTGRLHIHVVHLFRTLPDHWHDPNRGKLRPNNREIEAVRKLWGNGNSTPIAARFSPKDAYGLAGWRWPIDRRTNDALVIKSPLALANYMSKYINKGYTSCKRSELLWRVRKSQQLGRPILTELMSTFTLEQLVLMTSDPSVKLWLNNTRIPQSLLRLEGMRSIDHLCMTSPNSFGSSMEIAKRLTPQDSLLHSLKGSTRTTQESNQQNTMIISTGGICSTEDYEKARAAVYTAARVIDAKYFRRSLMRYGKTSTADWIHPANVTNAPPDGTRHTDTSIHQDVKQGEHRDKS